MGSGHRYELIKEGADSKEDADIKDEPQHTNTPFITSWWKFLLCNLLAASAGAAAMFLIARTSFGTQPSGSTAASVATSTSLSADLTLPTSSAEHVEGKISSPGMLAGEILDCGWSPEEARAKGCVYDVMMQDWVPVPCYDSDLTEKYLAEGNWTWYGDGEGKTIISDEEMRKGEHGYAWMATSYHHAHCVFSWVKLVGALRNNQGISEELLSNHHVMHCSHGALKESPNDEGLGVQAPTNYAKCALFETWKNDFSQMNIP